MVFCKVKKMKVFVGCVLFFLLIINGNLGFGQAEIHQLADDGTWCWFSDPRAIWLPDNGGTLLTGFVTKNGSVAALKYNLPSQKKTFSILNEMLEVDDHNNPAFALGPGGDFLAFYTKHHNTDLYINKCKANDDLQDWGQPVAINPNGKEDVEKFGDNKYTYANPFVLSGENKRIYLFGRWIGFKPNMSWSDDGGKTWVPGRVVISPLPFSWGQRPYVKYYSDGRDKIHIVFTDGHPRDEAFNSVYYAFYYRGAFFKADGQMICTLDQLPFQPKEATLIYDAKKTGHRAWVYDIVADKKGNPAVAYARYPSEQEHIYHYAWFDGKKWHDQEVVNSGKWFPQTPEGKKEREPHYSGGMSLSVHEKHTLFVSREVEGIFEIEKWQFQPQKKKWNHTPITQKSATDQVRPYVVKNSPAKAGNLVLWNSVERYVHYTDYHTRVMFAIVE